VTSVRHCDQGLRGFQKPLLRDAHKLAQFPANKLSGISDIWLFALDACEDCLMQFFEALGPTKICRKGAAQRSETRQQHVMNGLRRKKREVIQQDRRDGVF
jgi:hypothetical protein